MISPKIKTAAPCPTACLTNRSSTPNWSTRAKTKTRNRTATARATCRTAATASRAGDAETHARTARSGTRAGARPTHQCKDCHDSQIFIDASGRTGRQVRICNHHRSRRPATADEVNRYAAVIERINTDTWDSLNPELRAELIAKAQEAAA